VTKKAIAGPGDWHFVFGSQSHAYSIAYSCSFVNNHLFGGGNSFLSASQSGHSMGNARNHCNLRIHTPAGRMVAEMNLVAKYDTRRLNILRRLCYEATPRSGQPPAPQSTESQSS
jgi:hypothetical protein